MDAAELTFPLVPRRRPVGSAFGRLRAARRGIGSSVATTRPYRPGDDPGAIDWKLSARLSSIRGDTAFIEAGIAQAKRDIARILEESG